MNDQKRPPADDDATIMIPRPGTRAGGRSRAVSEADDATIAFVPGGSGSRPPMPPSGHTPEREPADPPEGLPPAPSTGVNPLVAAANRLLVLVPQLRGTLVHPDPAGVRTNLLELISAFEEDARAAGIPSEQVLVARYILCTVLDEAVSSTPWGSTGIWAQNSLLVTLHREGEGGEKFFQLLERMETDASRNIQLLELMYACLALGFQGRYRLSSGSHGGLSAVRERLFLTIRRVRGEFDPELSPKWRGVARAPRSITKTVPPWVVASALLFALFVVFLALRILLAQSSDPVQSALATLRAPTAKIERAPAPIKVEAKVEQKPRLRQFLLTEISQGMVEVIEDARSSRVVLNSDAAFAPGNALVNDRASAILARVANALNQVEGQVIITGHTDNVPIRTLRFPSNFELSLARAAAVQELLARSMSSPARVRHAGESDTRPIAPNDTPENRARNRRVEILLRVAG